MSLSISCLVLMILFEFKFASANLLLAVFRGWQVPRASSDLYNCGRSVSAADGRGRRMNVLLPRMFMMYTE